MLKSSSNYEIIAHLNPISIIFDSDDINYLIINFSIDQIRNEIRNSWKQLNSEVDWRWRYYLEDYIRICKFAIHILRSFDPQPNKIALHNFIDIDFLKSSSNIVSIAERYTHLIKAGRNFKGLCPLHTEKTASFMVYPDQQTWHCFGACNTGGDVIALVMRAENKDFKGAINILAGGI
jgi:hypothetical protein